MGKILVLFTDAHQIPLYGPMVATLPHWVEATQLPECLQMIIIKDFWGCPMAQIPEVLIDSINHLTLFLL